jgi:hypothetical protein
MLNVKFSPETVGAKLAMASSIVNTFGVE